MRHISSAILAGVLLTGSTARGMEEELPPAIPIAVAAPVEQHDEPPIAVRLLIRDEENGKREVLGRPLIRTRSGQAAQIEINRTGHRSLLIEFLASVEDEEADPTSAEKRPFAEPRNENTIVSTAGPTIRVAVSLVEKHQGKANTRANAQLSMRSGEPSSIKVGGLEVQLTALIVANVASSRQDESSDREELRLLRILQKRISIEFSEAPLGDVVREIGRRAEANVFLEPPALEDHGLTMATKVSVSCRGLRLSTVLDQMLAPLGLDYLVADEVIKITSRTRARGEPVTVSYAVADLISRLDNGRMVASVEAELDLIEKIAETIAPETWDRNGGRGSIRIFPPTQSLVVRQVADVHRDIAELLGRMRAVRKKSAEATKPEDEQQAVDTLVDGAIPAEMPNP